MINKLKFIIAVILTCACLPQVGHAQMNKVMNGDFEQKHTCPVGLNRLRVAKYWNGPDTGYFDITDPYYGNPYCTPAYANKCATDPQVKIPNNIWFYQYPRSGDGMINALVYFNDTPAYSSDFSRQYATGRLSTTLTTGQSYCVTFFTVRSNRSVGSYAIDGIGAYLDDGNIDTFTNCGATHMSITPQAYAASILYDTLQWMKVQGTFVANGTEKYITLGNFFDTAHTAEIRTGPHYVSYYQLDDVSVIATGTPAYAGADTLIIAGDTARLGVADSNGGGMPCWWYELGNPTAIDSGGTIWVHPADTTTYVVMMDLCGTITYDTVTVNVGHCTVPVDAAYTAAGTSPAYNYTYTGTTYVMDSVRWDFGDGAQSTTLNPAHTYTANGTYHVCVTVYTKCGSDSTCGEVVVNSLGLSTALKVTEPVIWPNPVGDELHIDGVPFGELTVTDVVGRVVYKARLASEHEVVDMRGMVKGVYMVVVSGDGGRYVRRVIKE